MKLSRLEPRQVESYRLVGYENRALAARDFNDDSKDAGEVGAGHTVTALYEIVPRSAKDPAGEVDALRYQNERAPSAVATSDEADDAQSSLQGAERRRVQADRAQPARGRRDACARLSTFRFSAAVAGFGLMLRHSPYAHDFSLARVRELAGSAMERDEHGDKAQFLELVRRPSGSVSAAEHATLAATTASW